MHSHVLTASTHTDEGPDWRLSDEFLPGSAEGSVAEVPPPAVGLSAGTAERLIFVARLERSETHCVPAALHCAGVMFSSDGGEHWGGELDDGELPDPMSKNTVAAVRGAGGRRMLAHVGSTSQIVGPRVNITCMFSRDGKAWGDPAMVLPELDAAGRRQIGGYAAAQGLPGRGGGVGVVFEAQLPPQYHLQILFFVVPTEFGEATSPGQEL